MRFRLISIAIIVFWSLLISGDLYALMPAKKAVKSKKTPLSQQRPSERISEEEEVAEIEKGIKEEIKKAKEERKKIIEKAKKEEGRREAPARPYVITKEEFETIYRPLRSEEPVKSGPLKTYNAIVSKGPFAVILTFFLLSIIVYLSYRLVLKKLSK